MPIRVLIVEDSVIFQAVLKKILSSTPDIEVVGIANNGIEGLGLIPQVNPDVISTDFHMPKMDGLEFIKQVMIKYPRPILAISVSVQTEQRHRIFQLLEAGAVDIFPKPRPGKAVKSQIDGLELINKIKVLAGVRVVRRVVSKRTPLKSIEFNPSTKIENSQNTLNTFQQVAFNSAATNKILVIGTSTGGPQALQTIFDSLPATFPVPIVCVQHISEGFLDGLIQWLALTCSLSIQVATAGTIPQPGTIYFPPENKHLGFNSQKQFVCSSTPPLGGHRPAVDFTFKSIAKVYGNDAIAVLLTGMGKDGASGMQEIALAGGQTIAQDRETSTIFGMPKEAIALGAVQHILPLPEITPFLLEKYS